MKDAGGFDSACGTYEDYVQYLTPLYGMLPAPLLIVGLEAPDTFDIVVRKGSTGAKYDTVRYAAVEL